MWQRLEFKLGNTVKLGNLDWILEYNRTEHKDMMFTWLLHGVRMMWIFRVKHDVCMMNTDDVTWRLYDVCTYRQHDEQMIWKVYTKYIVWVVRKIMFTWWLYDWCVHDLLGTLKGRPNMMLTWLLHDVILSGETWCMHDEFWWYHMTFTYKRSLTLGNVLFWHTVTTNHTSNLIASLHLLHKAFPQLTNADGIGNS